MPIDRWPVWPDGLPTGSIPKKEGAVMLQASSFSIAGGTAERLLRDFNQRLVDELGMMRRRDVKSKDIVDLRPVLDLKNIPDWQAPDPSLDLQDKLYAAQDYYYCYIPCFEEGVYHINAGRYIYWKVTDMDLARHRMMLWLQDFVYYSDGAGWQPGVHGNVAWRFDDPDTAVHDAFVGKTRMKCEYAATDDAVKDYVAMYRLLDVKKFGWSRNDLADWDRLVVNYARKACAMMLQKTGKNNLDSLAAMFTSYTVKTNRILSEHKAAAKSRPASKAEHEAYLREKAEAKKSGTKPAAQERRVRVVGPISVTSRSKPKPGHRAVANYTKAAWKTRGHLRTLKSGKKIYVRESVHRRKSLLTAETAGLAPEKTPLTIRLEKPETKEKREGGS